MRGDSDITKAEKREFVRGNNRKMVVRGRSIFGIARLMKAGTANDKPRVKSRRRGPSARVF